MSDPKSHMKAMAASMQQRTGKTVEEWVELVKQTLPEKKTGRLKWLKETYSLGHSTAIMILHLVESGHVDPAAQEEEIITNQYKKENEPLRPLFEYLSREFQKLGDDIRISPCKTYVPFYRKNIFVFVKPVKGKLHLGVALPEDFEHPRLSSAKDLKASERIKHQFVIETQSDFDDEALELVKRAYELN